MNLHRQIGLDVNTEVSNGLGRYEGVGADHQRIGRDLMLAARLRGPQDLRLGGVELQPIGPHPGRNTIDAGRHMVCQLCGGCRSAEAVDLCVVCIQMWLQIVLPDQPQPQPYCPLYGGLNRA